MQRNKERVIHSIRETVGKVLPTGAKVVLFGSQARGDAREDSDWTEEDVMPLIDRTEQLILKIEELISLKEA